MNVQTRIGLWVFTFSPLNFFKFNLQMLFLKIHTFFCKKSILSSCNFSQYTQNDKISMAMYLSLCKVIKLISMVIFIGSPCIIFQNYLSQNSWLPRKSIFLMYSYLPGQSQVWMHIFILIWPDTYVTVVIVWSALSVNLSGTRPAFAF